jgi:hypothetical protein
VLLITLQAIRDLSKNNYWAMSGFEKNQSLMREEFYRREIPRVYFRKIGYFYLTTARFTINRVDREFAKVLDINLNPVVVGALVLGVLLL